MISRTKALAITIGLTLLLSYVASSASQSIQGEENGNEPATPEVLSESEVLEALGVPNTSRDTLVEPSSIDTTESSVCTCEQVGKQVDQVKRGKDQGLVEENLVIEKKSGKSFDVITITIPNVDKKQKAEVETLAADRVEREPIALDEEDNKDDEDVFMAKQEEASNATKVEEESEVDSDFNKKKKDKKVKEDKKSSKASEKKRIKRTTQGSKRYGKKGKGKGKRR